MAGPYRAEFGAVHHERDAGFLFTVSGPAANAELVADALNVQHSMTDTNKAASPDHVPDARNMVDDAALSIPVQSVEGEPWMNGHHTRHPWAASGDQPERLWVLRFNDPDQAEMSWHGPDAEREAKEAYCRYSPAWTCALLATVPMVDPKPSEAPCDLQQEVSALRQVIADAEFRLRGHVRPELVAADLTKALHGDVSSLIAARCVALPGALIDCPVCGAVDKERETQATEVLKALDEMIEIFGDPTRYKDRGRAWTTVACLRTGKVRAEAETGGDNDHRQGF